MSAQHKKSVTGAASLDPGPDWTHDMPSSRQVLPCSGNQNRLSYCAGSIYQQLELKMNLHPTRACTRLNHVFHLIPETARDHTDTSFYPLRGYSN